jgi:CBS domain-containing protein
MRHSGTMRAEDLLDQVPTVRRDTTGAEAARVVAEYRLSGLVVADDDGVPIAVVPGSQLLTLILPRWVRDDQALAHTYDEKAADDLCRTLNEATIGALLDDEKLTATEPPSVLPEDTLVEIASVMRQGHSPIILVRERDGTFRGVLTMSRVLAAIATAAGQDSDLIRRRLDRDIIVRGAEDERGSS